MSDEKKREHSSGELSEQSFVEEKKEDHSNTISKEDEKPKIKKRFFTGSYTHGIDAKGRMIVPQSFRQLLGNQFVLAPTLDFKCIAIYPTEEWLKIEDMLENLLEKDMRAQKLIDQFNKYSYDESETDQQGRLLLPQKLRTRFLKDVRDIEINGAKTHVRVLEASVGEEEDEHFFEEHPDALSFLSELQK